MKLLMGVAVLLTLSSCSLPYGTRGVTIGTDTKTLTKNLNITVKQGLTDLQVTNNFIFTPNQSNMSESLFPSVNVKLEILAELAGVNSNSKIKVNLTSREYQSPIGHSIVFTESAGKLTVSCQMPDDSVCDITNLN
jgi:hypothetical protein